MIESKTLINSTDNESAEFIAAIENMKNCEKPAEIPVVSSRVKLTKPKIKHDERYRRRQTKKKAKSRRHHNMYYIFEGEKGHTVNKPYLRRCGSHRSKITGYYKSYSNRILRREPVDTNANPEENTNPIRNHGRYKRVFDYAWTID